MEVLKEVVMVLSVTSTRRLIDKLEGEIAAIPGRTSYKTQKPPQSNVLQQQQPHRSKVMLVTPFKRCNFHGA